MVSIRGGYTPINRDGYTEYRVHAGSTMTVVVGSGQTFENAHIDITRSGAGCLITVPGGWWSTPPSSFTIRNIGVEGRQPQRVGHILSVACRSSALIENCYFGDGTTTYPVGGNWNAHAGGPIARPTNSGTLTFRRVNACRWVDNGFYLSPPGRPGNGRGSIRIENCFAANNQISGFRVGTNDRITNSYSQIVSGGHRCLWLYNTPSCDTTIENSRFWNRGGAVAIVVDTGSTGRFRNSAWNGMNRRGTYVNLGGNSSSPSYFEPAGCPMSARDAYQGVGGSGPDPAPVEPTEPDEPVFDSSPLDPVDPDDFDHTIVYRNKTPDDHVGIDVWLNTTDPLEAVQTFDYDADVGNTSITNDANYAGLVRLSGLLTGVDGEDDSARAAFRYNGGIAAIRVNGRSFGRSSTPTGEVQIERNGSVLDLRDFDETPDPDELPDDNPVVSTGGASNITDESVTLHGAVHHMGTEDALHVAVWVRAEGDEFWPVIANVTSINQPTDLAQDLPNDAGYPPEFFRPGRTYEYRYVATSIDGSVEVLASIRSFTTQQTPPPDDPDDPDAEPDVPEGEIEPVNAPAGSIWFAPDPDGDRFTD